jgi:hypothetical protein
MANLAGLGTTNVSEYRAFARKKTGISRAGRAQVSAQAVIDGEAVILGADGIGDFNALHSGKQNGEVQFCAFEYWPSTGRMSGSCRYRCARLTWIGFFGPAGRHLHQPLRNRQHRP